MSFKRLVSPEIVRPRSSPALGPRVAWIAAIGIALASRVANAFLQPGPAGYDAFPHVAYVFFLDLYRAVPYADQGWSYFHPPLHYGLGWLLAQSGDAEVLVRGLSLLGSAASIGVAFLAAWIVREVLGQRPYLPVLAFVAVVFLPPHVYSSPMPGNELTAAFLGSAAVVIFLLNARRERASGFLDVAAGSLAGLALLTKFNALIPLLAILATLVLQLLRGVQPLRRVAFRCGLVAGVALLVAAPYYARNIAEFGNPFELSRTYPLVAALEADQPPGERSLRDFVYVPAQLFTDPRHTRSHLLHSVWGTLHTRMWSENVVSPELRVALVTVGLLPTLLVFLGFLRSLQVVRRDPAATVDAAMVVLAAGNVAAFAIFAWTVPIFSALKASYLMYLSLPVGLFVARVAAAPPRAIAVARGAIVVVVFMLVSVFVAVAFTPVIPRAGENAGMGKVRAYFGDYEGARATLRGELARAGGGILRARARSSGRLLSLKEALASVEIEAGRPAHALALYTEARAMERPDSPFVEERFQMLSCAAVAAALAGRNGEARRLLDLALAEGDFAEALVNRGALRALDGNLRGAEADLRRALELSPRLPSAVRNLAWVFTRKGDAEAGARELARAEQLARAAPRGFPYGIGNGLGLGSRRFTLILEGDRPALYRPARTRGGGGLE